MWESEVILDTCTLYYRVHKTFTDENGHPIPGAFRNRPNEIKDSMSTDWAKYSSAYEAHQRCKVPEANIIISLNVGVVRAIPGQSVVHSPLAHPDDPVDNRAHTDVWGIKTTEVRAKFMDAIDWPHDDRVTGFAE